MSKIISFIRLGDMDPDLFTRVAEETGTLLGCPVNILPPHPLDQQGYEPRKSQYSSLRLLESMLAFVEKGVPVIALVGADLSYPGLNFVFGLADELNQLAVVATARFASGQQATREKIIDRAVKTALHEAGHLLGLHHCSDQRCVMVLSFNLSDTDFKRKEFCEACRKKMEAGWPKRYMRPE
ncbi:MAG: archaemetzincin family Zn-dependent metalloprotease [Thermodesulfovibrionales bacterium]